MKSVVVVSWVTKSSLVVELVADDGKKAVLVTLGRSLLTSRGKYILGLATGSALTSVEAAASAVTRIDFVCILQIVSPRHMGQVSKRL